MTKSELALYAAAVYEAALLSGCDRPLAAQIAREAEMLMAQQLNNMRNR